MYNHVCSVRQNANGDVLFFPVCHLCVIWDVFQIKLCFCSVFLSLTLYPLNLFLVDFMYDIVRFNSFWTTHQPLSVGLWCFSVRRKTDTLRKHAYSNVLKMYWKFHYQKKWKFSNKNSGIFHISTQNIDCGHSLELPQRGDPNKYTQSIFWVKIRKIMYTPVNPSFTIEKWSLKGLTLYRHIFVTV